MLSTWQRAGGLLLTILSLQPVTAFAADYHDNSQLDARLEALARANPDLIRVQKLGSGGAPSQVAILEIGPRQKSRAVRLDNGAELTVRVPAMLALGGIEGNDLAGSFTLLYWAEQLARQSSTNDGLKKILDSTTIYVLPRVNREAASAYFARPRLETTANRLPVDDDHDGMTDEDGPEDLDGDGLITWMRVEDPEGEYIPDPQDARLLLKADRSRGEIGKWKLLPEGTDTDKDEAWNEDGPGGVNLNRNFPYQFKFFATTSGAHPMSEDVTRALADFIVAHPEIGLVFTFGAADNLSQTPKGEAPKRPPTAIHEDDVPFYRELGKAWRDALGLGKELNAASEPGTFSDWMYYHRGILSLAGRAWTPELQVELAKPKGKPPEKPASGGEEKPSETNQVSQPTAGKPGKPEDKDDKRNVEERAFIKWLDTNAPGSFVPWKEYQHPDFSGKRVEIGGFAPLARSNPPKEILEELAAKHCAFLDQLPGKLPRVELGETKVKDLGKGVFDVTLKVHNKGYLPTILSHGAITREINPTHVILGVDKKDLLSGEPRAQLRTIPGSGGLAEIRYVLYSRGKSAIPVHVISALGGGVSAEIRLVNQ